MLSSFLHLILLCVTRKSFNHSEYLPLGYLTKAQKMLTEHLPENLPPIPSHCLNPSRAYCAFLGAGSQRCSNAASLQLTQTCPLASNALFNFLSFAIVFAPIRDGHFVLPLSFCILQKPFPGCLAASSSLQQPPAAKLAAQPHSANTTAQDRAPPGSSRRLPQLHIFVPATLPVRCSFHP